MPPSSSQKERGFYSFPAIMVYHTTGAEWTRTQEGRYKLGKSERCSRSSRRCGRKSKRPGFLRRDGNRKSARKGHRIGNGTSRRSACLGTSALGEVCVERRAGARE